MPIIITNITSTWWNPKTDLNEYEVRINDKVIGKFEHKRSDGLSACLLRAAKCASDAEYPIVECELCKKPFLQMTRKRKYCSPKCLHEATRYQMKCQRVYRRLSK